jgi:hypothetical protein
MAPQLQVAKAQLGHWALRVGTGWPMDLPQFILPIIHKESGDPSVYFEV